MPYYSWLKGTKYLRSILLATKLIWPEINQLETSITCYGNWILIVSARFAVQSFLYGDAFDEDQNHIMMMVLLMVMLFLLFLMVVVLSSLPIKDNGQ